MTINWFSPLPPAQSSIALDTAAVLPALASKGKIVLWTHERDWSRSLEQHAEVRHYDPNAMPWEEVNNAEITFYHLGNHAGYHGPIWRVSRQHPGIVVLHDLSLQHFFAGLAAQTGVINPEEYLLMMEFHHSENGREVGQAFLAGTRSVDEICHECPLTGAAIENALGVAIHTRNGWLQVANTTDLPVAYVPLFAAPAASLPPGERERRAQESGRAGAPYRLIMFGFLGSNRRLEPLLQALHQFPQRDRFHLDVYGTLENEKSFLEKVSLLGLGGLVTVHGFVPEAELDEALRQSDIAINLRDPTMGETSASQLRIWQHGLPSLVTDIGWYATLPQETVALVRRDAELEDIQSHLEGFLQSPERYRELGRNGRLHVMDHHTVEAYVAGLMRLVEKTRESQAREAISGVSGRVGRLMRPWFDDDAAEILLPRLAETMCGLFDQPPSSR